MITIELTQEEKNMLIDQLNKVTEEKRLKLKILELEERLLVKVLAEAPQGVDDAWKREFKKKIKDWKTKIVNITELLANSQDYSEMVKSGNEVSFYPVINLILPLYESEKARKHTDAKYKYYPSLRKSKERALHVFANKLKTIMEQEYVRIA